MKRIKCVCNWTSDENLFHVINNVWNYDGKYNLVHNSDFDILIVFNKTSIRFDKQKTFGFIHEPTWSTNWDKNIHTYCNKVFYGNKFAENVDTTYPTNLIPHVLNTNLINGVEFTENKTKKLSIIASTIKYPHRINFINELLKTDIDFDLFGYGWNLTDSRYKGGLTDKVHGLLPYEYSICIENSYEPNYITEKFIDPILTDTVPIYFGATNISEFYPNCYKQINSIEELRNLGKTEIEFNLARHNYFTKYNPLRIVHENIN